MVSKTICETTEPTLSQDVTDNPDSVLASCLALLAKKSPDLAMVVKEWDTLPEAVRAGIVAMVRQIGTPKTN